MNAQTLMEIMHTMYIQITVTDQEYKYLICLLYLFFTCIAINFAFNSL